MGSVTPLNNFKSQLRNGKDIVKAFEFINQGLQFHNDNFVLWHNA